MLKRPYRITINLTAAEKIVLEDMAQMDGLNRCQVIYRLIRQEAYARGYWQPPANIREIPDTGPGVGR